MERETFTVNSGYTLKKLLFTLFICISSLGLVFCVENSESEANLEFEKIRKTFEKGELSPRSAIKSYRKLIKRYPESDIAPKAHYTIGHILESSGKIEKAGESYIAVIEKYPESEYYKLSVEELYRAGKLLFESANTGFFRNTFEIPKNIFEKLIEFAPYHEHSAEIRFKSGVCSMNLKDYEGAISVFENLIKEYKQEPWIERAYYRLCDSYFKQSLPARHDQTMTDKAITELLRFKEKYPGSSFIDDVNEKLTVLNERKAESMYLVCLFYWNNGEEEAYSFYLDKLTGTYPDNKWTEQAKSLRQ